MCITVSYKLKPKGRLRVKVNKAEYIATAVYENQFPNIDYPEVVFCGRSNVGKSSLINMLTGRKKLAYFSQRPGKTQTLNFYNINDELTLVDIPGYGFAKVSKKMQEAFATMITMYFEKREQCAIACLLLDIRHKPTADDLQMFEFFQYYQIPVVILCTKGDKISKNQQINHIKKTKEALGITGDEVPFVLTSAETGLGRDKAWAVINEEVSLWKAWRKEQRSEAEKIKTETREIIE